MRFAINDPEVEALARELLRETILRSGWYPHLWPEDRERRIEEDVNRHWHLLAETARDRLEQRARGEGA
jgi:hypothetical protein